jgi:hypothetical protein
VTWSGVNLGGTWVGVNKIVYSNIVVILIGISRLNNTPKEIFNLLYY